ncbi:hypothetical protein Tco_0520581 [Tanacetum coccineum]
MSTIIFHHELIPQIPCKAIVASRAVDPVGSPSSTTIDQDEQSTSTSPTNQEIQSQVTHQDSAHPFESPPAGKTDITFTRRRVPSNWLIKMKFNRLLNIIWMIMSTIYNKTTRKLPVVEVKGKGSATDVQAAKSLLELHKPKKQRSFKDGDGDGDTQSRKGVKASANSDIIFFFTSAQDGNRLLDDERLSLADDLKKAHDHNQNKSK